MQLALLSKKALFSAHARRGMEEEREIRNSQRLTATSDFYMKPPNSRDV